MAETFTVKLWGVRGSIPCPGRTTQKYGGNGACIELRVGLENRLVVIDAGSGIRALGNALMNADVPRGSLSLDLFLSHTHWDHIMGFPFFAPIYLPTTRMNVYGPVSYEENSLEDVVGGQMKYRYFPVNVGELSSHINYRSLQEISRLDMGRGLQLTTKYLNHPVSTLGYRFEYGGKVFCTCYDTEPFRNLFVTDRDDPEYDEMLAYEGELVAAEQNRAIESFFAGADVLIHDAQYTQQEYETMRRDWGHSPIEHVIQAAERAGVKRLVLFHHDPDRTDAQLDLFSEKYCQSLSMQVEFAREGMQLDL
ncbi:MBL fold metallo-hydrolase [Desulfotalea psychrophila]|uniref:Metallo-beta-lactamase domain-containing protein n=1 Tax=Desulfotalea psychrophila (strain LSv54 / DSM 12343) TaxID=177439 RepID=Q6ASD1_DESPS|nr:MBL fold metallo-hydrolase [Desulfotalea psychrophila]CAG34732.1 conserved hypothetical protein [Desulfotalea psychrophila LSv54]